MTPSRVASHRAGAHDDPCAGHFLVLWCNRTAAMPAGWYWTASGANGGPWPTSQAAWDDAMTMLGAEP